MKKLLSIDISMNGYEIATGSDDNTVSCVESCGIGAKGSHIFIHYYK